MINNQRGNVLLAMLVVILIAIFEAYYFFNSNSFLHQRNQRRYLAQGSVKEVLFTTDQILDSPKSLANTIQGELNNGNASLFKCMTDGAYDCPAAGGPFSIYLDVPSMIFSDAIDPAAGLDLSLQKCNGYNQSSNQICVMKLNLAWKPECPAAGPCILPPIVVDGKVDVKMSFIDSLVLNTNSFIYSRRLR